MMNNPIIVDWNEDNSQTIDRSIIQAKHRLLETGLFSDERLIEVIDCHPREDMRINTTDPKADKPEWRDGDLTALSAQEIFEAVRKGRLWLNIFNFSKHNSIYRKITHKIYEEIEQRCPHFRAYTQNENILISSPRATVSFHIDPGPAMLWHIRGKKRVWVYPQEDSRFISQAAIERICTRKLEGWEVPYDKEFDRHAKVYDLEPGDMVYWPQFSPHRVENLNEFNVSITSNHNTWGSIKRNSVYRANEILRRKFNIPCKSTDIKGVIGHAKVAGLFAARVTRLYSLPHFQPEISFCVDPKSPDGFCDLVADG